MRFLKSLLGRKSSQKQQEQLDDLSIRINALALEVAHGFELSQGDLINVLATEVSEDNKGYTEIDKSFDAQYYKGERAGYSTLIQLMLHYFPNTNNIFKPVVDRVSQHLVDINTLNGESEAKEVLNEQPTTEQEQAASRYTIEQVQQQVLIEVSQIIVVPVNEVRLHDSFVSDLGFDDVDMAHLTIGVECVYNIKIPGENVETVSDFANLVYRVLIGETTYQHPATT